jgi:protein-L-isoaspartate O-methyltransferase
MTLHQADFTATYSPDDNKLRLSAAHRLDPDLYARVREAGYIWAPKLEQFVAPCWTPEREDLAIELAGEILDEDSTLLDRAEDRAERFEGYQSRRRQEAESARRAVDRIAQRFEGGQPIILAHHSTRRALRDKEKIEDGMRRAVSLFRTSEYWQARAAGAIRHAKYKERPDVRHRRIKTLAADRRRWLRAKEKAAASLRLWETIDDPAKSPFKRRDGQPTTTLERARFLAGSLPSDLTVARTESRSWTAWHVLQPDGERYNGCPAMTVEQVQEAAREAYPRTIAHCDRWIEHLDNRLTYEHLMLEEQGGYQEKKKPRKTELPLLNYSGPVAYRSHFSDDVVEGDAVGLTKAEWAAIHTDYKGTAPSACGTHRVRTTMAAPGRRHQRVAVYITDAKQHPRPSAEAVAAKAEADAAARSAERTRRLQERTPPVQPAEPQPADPGAAAFRQLAETAARGIQVVTAPQLFPTPPDLAARMAELAKIQPRHRVLEPQAGTGNLVRAALDVAPVDMVAVEIHPQLAALLRSSCLPVGQESRVEVRCCDFLECQPDDLGLFDAILMNPPFDHGLDIKHIDHAIQFLRPGGILSAICANGPRQQAALQPRASFWEDLPSGSFKTAGTNVNTALLMIQRPQD